MAVQALDEQLYQSATRFAQSGLRAFLEEDSEIFLLHAAIALEHLAKANLAALHGSLVAGKDFDSLLHTCGLSQHAERPPSVMKTIGTRDALDRSGQLIPELRNIRSSLNLLVEIRNGIVHAGQLELAQEEAVLMLIPFLRACDYLLASLTLANRESFWQDLLDMVDVRLSESAKAAERSATDSVAAARLRFQNRFGAMAATARAAVIASIEQSYDPRRYEEAVHACPACEHLALVSGSHNVDWKPEYEYDRLTGEDYVIDAYPVVTFLPGTLECRICDLVLDGEEQLRAAGLPTSWQLADVDPKDFYEQDELWDE